MIGMSMHGRRKAAGAATGEYCAWPSRQARLRTSKERIKIFANGASGRKHRRLPAVLPRRLSICSADPIPLAILPPGGTPPKKGGECLRTPHALNTVPIASTPSSQSTKIPEEPNTVASADNDSPGGLFPPPCTNWSGSRNCVAPVSPSGLVGRALRASRFLRRCGSHGVPAPPMRPPSLCGRAIS